MSRVLTGTARENQAMAHGSHPPQSNNRPGDVKVPGLYAEKYRPQLHYSPAHHWLSDPNGLVWYAGKFHLFYQHNPQGNDWGNMHWGHAVSPDLVNWTERPVAIPSDPWGAGFAFSGCIVVDHENRSGLATGGATAMVAIYTGAAIDGTQSQCLAYSLDSGDTWTLYRKNPVIPNPGLRDYRDPKVFWDPGQSAWVMILAAGDRLLLYVSTNLLQWEQVSEFSCTLEHDGDVLECPDLFPLRAADGETHWVLIVSATNATKHKSRATRYFIGSFDGRQFKSIDQAGCWLDWGPDNYATVTWDNVPTGDGRRLSIGWMSNWRYAREAPTYPWRGHMTFARELKLTGGKNGLQLAAHPVPIPGQQQGACTSIGKGPIDGVDVAQQFAGLPADLLDLQLEFSWADRKPLPFDIVFSSAAGDTARIIVDVASSVIVLDRSKVGRHPLKKDEAGVVEAPLSAERQSLDIRLLKDRACLEVFADEGRVAMSANLFFDEPFDSVSLSGGSDVEVQGEALILQTIWNDA